MRRTSWMWLLLYLLCLLPCSPALGENASYSFAQEGLRVYLPGDWQVLTLTNLADKAQEIQSLGTTAEALTSSFLDTGTLLEAYPAEGGQLRIQRNPLPESLDARDAFSMTAEQKESFLLEMARLGGFAHGVWSQDLPEFAVFMGSTSMQSLPVQTITYATVRYGQVYTVSADIIGREPTDKDEAALKTAASAMLFLGTQETPPPEVSQAPQATLDLTPAPTPEPAEIRVQRDETNLTLDYAPSVSKTTKLTLTGVTEPNISMRYYVNGQGYERFKSDDQGRFTCLVRDLPKAGKNIVAIHAIGDKGYGVVAFTVVLEQEYAPLAVTPLTQGVAGDSVLLTGAVLPGGDVQIIHRTKTYDATVNGDGSFVCEVELPRLGENAFTVRASMTGYMKKDEKLTIVRILSEADERAAFQKKLKHVAYDKLTERPESYKDAPVKYQGRVLALWGQSGQPLAVIATEDGTNPVAVLCTSLHGLELNQEVAVLCTLTGALREAALPGGTSMMPEARLNWILPNE